MAAKRLPPFCLGADRRRPRSNKRQMTIPDKWARSSGKAVASWRDINSEDRENCVRMDLTRRLRCVCKELSIVDFEALVSKMASEQLRGERTLHRWIAKN